MLYAIELIGKTVSPTRMFHSRSLKSRSSASPFIKPVKPFSALRANRGMRVH